MEEVEDIIWEEFDYFLYKTGGVPSSLHLPRQEKDLIKPHCEQMLDDTYDLIPKPVSAYPKGYRKICGNCLMEWREMK